MKCEDIATFVSAICDGQTIPREAAEHIGKCESCRTQLREYLELGAELRRFASLESVGEIRVIHWEKKPRASASWWRRGWETVRIPRLAFALLLATVFVLASNLVMGRVRAHTRGRVLMLMAKPAEGHTLPCTLYTYTGNNASCSFEQTEERKVAEGLIRFESSPTTETTLSWALGPLKFIVPSLMTR